MDGFCHSKYGFIGGHTEIFLTNINTFIWTGISLGKSAKCGFVNEQTVAVWLLRPQRIATAPSTLLSSTTRCVRTTTMQRYRSAWGRSLSILFVSLTTRWPKDLVGCLGRTRHARVLADRIGLHPPPHAVIAVFVFLAEIVVPQSPTACTPAIPTLELMEATAVLPPSVFLAAGFSISLFDGGMLLRPLRFFSPLDHRHTTAGFLALERRHDDTVASRSTPNAVGVVD